VDDQREKLRERIAGLSDDQLIEMVTAAADDYVPEAVEFAVEELESRGISVPAADSEDSEEEPAEPSPAAARNRGKECSLCGGSLRKGSLVAERELSIIFADNKEERFIRVTACSDCGHAALFVDFETTVE
jgi:hypothetical protein